MGHHAVPGVGEEVQGRMCGRGGGTIGRRQLVKNPELRGIVPSAASELQMMSDEALECSLAQCTDLFTWVLDTNEQRRGLPHGRVLLIINMFL